jgi:hypothetical protein
MLEDWLSFCRIRNMITQGAEHLCNFCKESQPDRIDAAEEDFVLGIGCIEQYIHRKSAASILLE